MVRLSVLVRPLSVVAEGSAAFPVPRVAATGRMAARGVRMAAMRWPSNLRAGLAVQWRRMARDVSRSMSRQLSVMMSRVGRSVRQDDSRVSRVAPPSPRRSPVPPEIAAEVAARPYRRSRARMITAKWRRGRVRPNPIGIAVGVMVAILAAVVVLVGGGAGMAYAVNYYNAHIGQIQAIADLRYNDNSVIYDRNGTVIYVAKGDDSELQVLPQASETSARSCNGRPSTPRIVPFSRTQALTSPARCVRCWRTCTLGAARPRAALASPSNS